MISDLETKIMLQQNEDENVFRFSQFVQFQLGNQKPFVNAINFHSYFSHFCLITRDAFFTDPPPGHQLRPLTFGQRPFLDAPFTNHLRELETFRRKPTVPNLATPSSITSNNSNSNPTIPSECQEYKPNAPQMSGKLHSSCDKRIFLAPFALLSIILSKQRNRDVSNVLLNVRCSSIDDYGSYCKWTLFYSILCQFKLEILVFG